MLIFYYLNNFITNLRIPTTMMYNVFTNDILFANICLLDVLVYLNEFTFNDTSLEEDMILLTNAENENNYKIKIKIEDFAELLVPKFTNKEFKSHFRVNRSSIEVVMTFIGPALSQKSIKINVEKQILIFIWYMANCETHRQIGNRFNIAESTSHDIITNCLLAMNDVAGKIIVWPTGVAALENIQKFNSLRGLNSFPNVFGCIDGCHINTLFPWEKRTKMPKLDRNMFCNRKQVPSVVLQVGDSGYPLRPWLLTPITHLTTAAEELYNNKQMSTRSSIERCNGVLKIRFRCLFKDRVLHYKPKKSSQIINACVVLHNMCIEHNVPEIRETEEDIDMEMNQDQGPFEEQRDNRNQYLMLRKQQRSKIIQVLQNRNL
eukprot:XP_016656004.1 PREDICTED: putative nuclease HARBI1 [Acyrthosiphon pisum]